MAAVPIAWLALRPGTPIYSSDDDEIGKVDEVVADREKDIFSGISFKPRVLGSLVFVPAARIERMTESGVHLDLSADQIEQLEPYES